MTPTHCPLCNKLLTHELAYYCEEYVSNDFLSWKHYIFYPISNHEIFRFTINNSIYSVINHFNNNSSSISSYFDRWQLITKFNYPLPHPKIHSIVNRLANLKAFI